MAGAQGVALPRYRITIPTMNTNYLDWNEMPAAHEGGPDQDRFELFARDFLDAQGFTIVEGPGRGVDRGRDLIVHEPVTGMLTSSEQRWLVSVKHRASSGRSVTPQDEADPIGRVRIHSATGFMAVYSTLPSSTLDDAFDRMRKQQIAVHVFDRGRIERLLLSDNRLRPVFKTYFPQSYERFMSASGRAIPYVEALMPLSCEYCGKDLLADDSSGLIAWRTEKIGEHYQTVDIYVACRGACDERMSKNRGTTWRGLEDLRIPLVFVQFVISTMNQLRWSPESISDAGFDKTKDVLLAVAQFVLRETTEDQWAEIEQLRRMPNYMGGLGE